MPIAIFEIPFSCATGLDFNGYELPYDTGETVTVNRENEQGEIVPTEVPLIKGGYSILENVEPNLTDVPLRVSVEASQETIDAIKVDPDYIWVKDLGEDE
jgi:hypothetical protein